MNRKEKRAARYAGKKLLAQIKADFAALSIPVPVESDVPVLVARTRQQEQQNGQTYEEANWAKLSPAFRIRHNQLRAMRGLSPIPEPKVDLYVPKRPHKLERLDPNNKEFLVAARQFLGGTLMGGGHEGFEIREEKSNWIE